METQKEKCSSFDKCSAPLCPENPESLEDRWYPEEEICTCHKDTFIKVQLKIAIKAIDKTRYFTYGMLNKNCVIAKGIRGIDPDCRNEKQAIETWLSNHKSKRILTDIEKTKLHEIGIKSQFKPTSDNARRDGFLTKKGLGTAVKTG